MSKKKTKLQELTNQTLLIASVSGSANTLSVISSSGENSSVTTKISGWFSDNYRTYFVDDSGKKHYQ